MIALSKILNALWTLVILGVVMWGISSYGGKMKAATEELEVLRNGFFMVACSIFLGVLLIIVRLDSLKKDE